MDARTHGELGPAVRWERPLGRRLLQVRCHGRLHDQKDPLRLRLGSGPRLLARLVCLIQMVQLPFPSPGPGDGA